MGVPATGEHVDERGTALLAQISSAIVTLQKEFFGKGPSRARSHLIDDMLFVVMHGGLTTAEETMLKFGHPDQVRAFRQLYENEMTEKLTAVVERLTGRSVLSYQSQIMFDPVRVIEVFVFADGGTEDAEAG